MIPARASAVAAGVSMVTAGSMLANLASYALQVVAADLLGPAGYGEFGPLLARSDRVEGWADPSTAKGQPFAFTWTLSGPPSAAP